MTETKKQTEITREEWIVYQWLDITTLGSTERMYVRGMMRPLHEADQAARDYDTFHAALTTLNDSQEPEKGGEVIALAVRETLKLTET